MPIKIGPNDHNDQLFLGLNTNLAYVVFVHDPEYFMFNVNPVSIPAATKKFTTHKKEPNRFYYRMDLVEVNNLNRQHKPCKDNPDYSFLACLRKSIACTVTSVAFCQIARKLSSFPPGDLAVHDSQSFLAAA